MPIVAGQGRPDYNNLPTVLQMTQDAVQPERDLDEGL